jgi:hypothetical protein
MRRQLRPFYTPDQLAVLYATPYDHTRWPDHVERVAETIRRLDRFAGLVGAHTVADLSAGDGAILNGSRHPWRRRILGDITEPAGPIEQSLPLLEPIDMFVCSETLEHVRDPDALLAGIRAKSRHLLLTTPHDEPDDSNPEHYWAWGADDVALMLEAAGWHDREVELFTPASTDHYTFQIWMCR